MLLTPSSSKSKKIPKAYYVLCLLLVVMGLSVMTSVPFSSVDATATVVAVKGTPQNYGYSWDVRVAFKTAQGKYIKDQVLKDFTLMTPYYLASGDKIPIMYNAACTSEDNCKIVWGSKFGYDITTLLYFVLAGLAVGKADYAFIGGVVLLLILRLFK